MLVVSWAEGRQRHGIGKGCKEMVQVVGVGMVRETTTMLGDKGKEERGKEMEKEDKKIKKNEEEMRKKYGKVGSEEKN